MGPSFNSLLSGPQPKSCQHGRSRKGGAGNGLTGGKSLWRTAKERDAGTAAWLILCGVGLRGLRLGFGGSSWSAVGWGFGASLGFAGARRLVGGAGGGEDARCRVLARIGRFSEERVVLEGGIVCSYVCR